MLKKDIYISNIEASLRPFSRIDKDEERYERELLKKLPPKMRNKYLIRKGNENA